MITIIVACDRHNLIGDSQSPSGMPWHHAEDFAHFKKTTLNHTILMGRKTYEAIGRPLPKRQTLVLSSQPLDLPEGARWVSSLEEVLQAYRQSGEDLYICGGASIYKQCYPWADQILLSRIPGDHQGDAWLADFSAYFELDHSEPKETFTLEIYRRKPYA